MLPRHSVEDKHAAILGLGSNIKPAYHIAAAKDLLNQVYDVAKWSSFHRTSPVGVRRPQPDFINCGCLLYTSDSASKLKAQLRQLEHKLGRKPNTSAQPRCIDLDILVWDDKLLDADAHKRQFLQDIILELRPEHRILFRASLMPSQIYSNT